jgi:beta-aspartyl-dipeptidase (metallo-type)
MAFIPAILGVKIALADHRGSYPSFQELLRIVSDIRVASLLAGKRLAACAPGESAGRDVATY